MNGIAIGSGAAGTIGSSALIGFQYGAPALGAGIAGLLLSVVFVAIGFMSKSED